MNNWRGLICGGLMGLLLACGLPKATSDSPMLTAAGVPSPATPACPVHLETAFPDYPGNFSDIAATLEHYLTQGGDPYRLPELLHTWNAYLPRGSAPIVADFTGDGLTAVAIVYVDPASAIYPPASALVAYACRDGAYMRLPLPPDAPDTGVYLAGASDLDGDGNAELGWAEFTCGAHTCWDTLWIWDWTGEAFQTLPGAVLTLPNPTFTLTDDRIVAMSSGIGSLGAGPQRIYTETWAWDGQVLTRTEFAQAPAVFRYHVLVEGDQAVHEGRYPAAYAAYQRVLHDEALQPWAGYTSAAEELVWLTALAQWRLLVLGMATGNYPDAERYYIQLTDASAPVVPVAQIAERFWQTYLAQGHVGYACQEAINGPESPIVLEFLNGFGYANPAYSREELCPFQNP